MATHKPFRELIPAGTNFEFMGRARIWITLSLILMAASIGAMFVNKAVRGDYLNWTIDFKGGTEIVFAFEKAGAPTHVSAGDVRAALEKAGYAGFSVSEFSWDEESGDESGTVYEVDGMRVTL